MESCLKINLEAKHSYGEGLITGKIEDLALKFTQNCIDTKIFKFNSSLTILKQLSIGNLLSEHKGSSKLKGIEKLIMLFNRIPISKHHFLCPYHHNDDGHLQFSILDFNKTLNSVVYIQ